MKIKEIPQEERPYERCYREGPSVLSDTELLSIIIRTGSGEYNSLDLARQILALNYPNEGLLGLLHLSLSDLMKVHGIGKVKGIQLLCIAELSKRIWRSRKLAQEQMIQTPDAIADFYMESMRHLEWEETHLMVFNSRQVLIRELCVARGSVNAVAVGPREIFTEALHHHAVTIALVHNHPSGDPEPSREDIMLTGQLVRAGALLGVPLVDHIIIGDGQFVSLKERGFI